MAASASAAWNRVRIPSSGSISTVPVRAGTAHAAKCLASVSRESDRVLKVLSSPALEAESLLLRAVLYSHHHRMGRHKPHLALKQVEQCLKRLESMRLVSSIGDLSALCTEDNPSRNAAECIVPSQPVVELALMKILGACKLVLRLLDCCCKTFLLFVKHLCVREFLVLNLVVAGLVSRLWVLFRAVLKKLTWLYEPLLELLLKSSEARPMPYFQDFHFPLRIAEFLGPAYAEVLNQQPPRALAGKGVTRLLNKLFPAQRGLATPGEEAEAGPKVLPRPEPEKQGSHVDLGRPVPARGASREKLMKLDVKTLCRPPKPKTAEVQVPSQVADDIPQDIPFKTKRPASDARSTRTSSSGQSAKSLGGTALVSRLREAQCFAQLSEVLRTAVVWCRSQKRPAEAVFLGNKLLKSNRLKHVEAQGYSLPKKLNCMKTSVCNRLLRALGKKAPRRQQMPPSSQTPSEQRPGSIRRKPVRAVLKEIRPDPEQTESPVSGPCVERSVSPASAEKTEFPPLLRLCAGNGTPKSSASSGAKQTSAAAYASRERDDIDDIFSSIGL
ncbi:nucleolus and neural progenitor protein isoform X2 [Tachyglossus aculeatus]|uniref:nucleolus and neural progenitor protein isoform X2 n=1 Tax=Tachyglossus aculeatus TaxID=9261 RepID=UPI0018F4BD3F|nr:nucleolus and neural progenitor protein isoform X2 [Tachyglossus aculeatus]